MGVAQQHVPVLSRLRDAAGLAGATALDLRPLAFPAEGIGASIERIVQDLHDAVIRGRFPDQLLDVDVAQDDGHLQAGLAQPQEDLPRAAQLAELGEDQTDRLDDMLVGIDLDLSRLAPAEAGRQHEPEFAASRLLVARHKSPLPHQAQLVF